MTIGTLFFILSLILFNVFISNAQEFANFKEYYDEFNLRADFKEKKTMYPYNATFYDKIATNQELLNGFDAGVNWNFLFYGIRYKTIWISRYGHLSFSKKIPSQPTQYLPDGWPNPNYPNSDDFPFVAPFFANLDFKANRPGELSKLFYRVLDVNRVESQARMDITKGMLAKISDDVIKATPGIWKFEATKGLIVTYHRVSFTGAACPLLSQCPRNTFQIALVTDENMMFVVFNYMKMSWVGTSESFCDPNTGFKNDNYPNCIPSRIGINAGRGREFTKLAFSNTFDIIKLPTLKNAGSNILGRFFFRVDNDLIIQGGCSGVPTISNSRPLQIVPYHAHMLGGKPIAISGPCFQKPDTPFCRFDNLAGFGGYVVGPEINSMKTYCVSPALSKISIIEMSASAENGQVSFKTQLDVGRFTLQPPKLKIITTDKWNWLDDVEINLEWKIEDISFITEFNTANLVDVVLMGYREDISTGKYEISVLERLAKSIPNTGKFTFKTADHLCKNNDNINNPCKEFDVGSFTVWKSDTDPNNPFRIWSQFIPLGWYVKTYQISKLGNNWAAERCKSWMHNEPRASIWKKDLLPCPCTLQQALDDFTQFQPDQYCRYDSKERYNCERHVTAVHCVRSVTSVNGAGSHCCYDKLHNLIYASDSIYGSTSDRAHEAGHLPYSTPPYIPTLSHAVNEIVPYALCCVYSNDKLCFETFLNLRPTSDCKNYVPPETAAVFGDPHIITWENVKYTFNGFGEYWLVKNKGGSNQIKLQARFTALLGSDGNEIKATGITAIAVKDNDNGHSVQVEVNHEDSKKKLRVYVRTKMGFVEKDFGSEHLWWQDYDGLTVINNSPLNDLQDNLTIICKSGLGLEIKYIKGMVNLLIKAPQKYKTHFQGLLGNWDDDSNNDLMSQKGEIVSANDREILHNKFGLSWQVTDAETLFKYRSKKNFEYYKRPDFIPIFNNGDNSSSICTGFECAFDYKLTNDEFIARETLKVQERVKMIKDKARLAPKSCGLLDIPFSVKKNPRYLYGDAVEITGCLSGYKLDGPSRYTCNSDGYWSPSITTRCLLAEEVKTQEAALYLGIFIPVGIVLIVLVIGIIALVFYCRKRMSEKNIDEQKEIDIAGSDVIKVKPIDNTAVMDTSHTTWSTSIDISHEKEKPPKPPNITNNAVQSAVPVPMTRDRPKVPPPRAPLITQSQPWTTKDFQTANNNKGPESVASSVLSDLSLKPVPLTRPDLIEKIEKPPNYPSSKNRNGTQEPLLNRPPTLPKPTGKKPRPGLNKSQESLC